MTTHPHTTQRQPGTAAMMFGVVLWVLAFALLFAPMNAVLPTFLGVLGLIMVAMGGGQRLIHEIRQVKR